MYDSDERCLTMTTVASGSATYSYSEDGDLVEVTYVNGNRRTFEYDEYNRLSAYGLISPMDEVVSRVSVVPEWNGKVTMVVQPMNKTIEAMYNTNGEVVFFREEGSLPLILAQLPGRSTLLFGDKVFALLCKHRINAMITTTCINFRNCTLNFVMKCLTLFISLMQMEMKLCTSMEIFRS